MAWGRWTLDAGAVARGEAMFATVAAQLDAHLTGRDWLLDGGPSHADFRMGAFLPFNDVARLPVADYPAVAAWAAQLDALPFWADPFAGLDAPPLPPVGRAGRARRLGPGGQRD